MQQSEMSKMDDQADRTDTAQAQDEAFRQMIEESLREQPVLQRGQTVQGTVVGQDNDAVIVDVGSKGEGMVPKDEFKTLGVEVPAVGEQVDVLVQALGGRAGLKLSVLAARRVGAWEKVEQAVDGDETLEATVLAEVKGGFKVSLDGLMAFMPRSEADPDPRYPAESLIGQTCQVAMLSARRKPENVVVSRKQPLEVVRKQQQQEFFSSINVGDKVNGEVKRLTDFGAFVDVGGIDALLHISDIAWQRIKHPSEMLSVGQHITAEVIKMNEETGKVSLSMRVLQSDPWEGVAEKYVNGMRLTGTVRRVLDFGAMIELEPGVEGMIHRSEMSWTRRDVNPADVLNEGDVVDVMVLDVDTERRRIALSLKAVTENPWQAWLSRHPVGSKIPGSVRNITEFGMFVGLDEELDGLVHIGNLSWTRPGEEVLKEYQKGQEVECVVLGVEVDRQRISLGIKQLDEDPFDVFLAGAGRGSHVHGKVTEVKSGAVIVELAEGIEAVLPLREVPREHTGFNVGDEVEAKIIDVNRKRRQVGLSVRQLLRAEENEAVRSYLEEARSDTKPSALALELQRKLLDKERKKA
ncbi:MAG TPA: 30S ribosomal protein S1 [Mariprofundaceae bacterium]|nr:30S ribosomal protein S1 [Mariprofundaceae bacterium]